MAAIYPLAKQSVKSINLALIGIAVLLTAVFGVNEIYLMFGAGLLTLGLYTVQNRQNDSLQSFVSLTFLQMTQTTFWIATNANCFGRSLILAPYFIFAVTLSFSNQWLSSRAIVSTIAIFYPHLFL